MLWLVAFLLVVLLCWYTADCCSLFVGRRLLFEGLLCVACCLCVCSLLFIMCCVLLVAWCV